jgi:CRISPR-associated endonuclease/helicase Cas3
MSDTNSSREAFFNTAFGVPAFDYQHRLAEDGPLRSSVNVPTDAGKTAAVIGAWLWRRFSKPGTVDRRKPAWMGIEDGTQL